jgi:hypothetical protein
LKDLEGKVRLAGLCGLAGRCWPAGDPAGTVR